KHSSINPLKRVNSGSMELFLEYFETTPPEKYRFLDYYQYCKNLDGFVSNFRQEARRLQVALEHLVENDSGLRKQKAQCLLDVFEAREHTSTTTVSAYAPLTLWRSLDPVVVYKFCRGGGLQQSREGVTLTQLWRVPTYHPTLRRSLDPVVNHRKKNVDIDKFWNEVEDESLDIEQAKEKKHLQLDQLKIARVMTKGTEDGIGNIMKNVNTELVESATYLKRRRDVDYKEDRDGYTTPCPNSSMVNNPEDEPKPKRRAKADDKSCTSSSGTSDDMLIGINFTKYKSVDEESEESEESDEEDKLRLDVEEIGFEEYIDQGNKPFIFKTKNISSLFKSYRSKALAHAQNSGLIMTKNYHEILSLSHILLLQMDNYSETQVKTFSRETLEDLRKDIKSKLIGKEKVTRDIKSILQEYIEVALDDNDGGLHELRETITESFSKEFNSTAEKEFLRRMKFLFEHLSYTIPLHPLKEIISEGTLLANIISPILRIFFHDSYIYPTIWPNTSSTSAKIRKLAIGDPSRAKQPDMIGKTVNNGKYVYETMFGEVTGEGKNNTEKKNIIDLVRLGIFMKDSLDNISRKTGVNRIFGWQVIVTKWTGYMMTLISPGIYVMIDTGSVDLPRSFEVCNTFLTGLDTLFAFKIAYEKTIKDILSIMNKSEEFESDDNFKGWRRSTLGTPLFKKI
ncbi:11643_t:CDS:10, partial [Acaulospora morrowiae]